MRIKVAQGGDSGNVPLRSLCFSANRNSISKCFLRRQIRHIGLLLWLFGIACHTAPYYQMGSAPGRDPIVIDISSVKNDSKLDVPAWPGDVIIVPAAGEVMVRGWVKNPGAFNITPGMTVLGAVTAAGGELYSSSAQLLRTADDGRGTKEYFNLGKIQRGTEPDIPVESGDVVIVNRSVAGAVPYFIDTLFSKFTTGALSALALG